MTTKERIAAKIQVLKERINVCENIMMQRENSNLNAHEISSIMSSLLLYQNQVAGTTNDIFMQESINRSFNEELDIIKDKIEKLLSLGTTIN